ncbi:MAG: DNA topoisomerase 3 [Acidobacteriota bacterium]|nr:DNA topoisomerase 3 [Acidobacteriota bacterium]
MAGFRLIVTEKPSVARDIARVLGISGRGDGFIGKGATRISWCLGHLLELAPPAAYDERWRSWRLENLPILVSSFRLSPREDSKDQWRALRALLTDPHLEEVINACDAGREGELIFAYARQASGCKAPVRRLWISSMTDQAIREGFDRLRDGSDFTALEAAARCRSEADWLVGLNATRAMTLRARRGSDSRLLSLGRVQTPTLALICRREQEIENFEPQTFWQVRVRFAVEDGSFLATWTRPGVKGDQADRLDSKQAAEAICSRIEGRDGIVTRADGRRVKEKPPLLYDLTALQKEANARFGLSAQKTLDLAQSLYERKKVITYPRTDARHLGSDLVDTLPGRIRSLGFGPYEKTAGEIIETWPPKLGKRVIDDAEVSDHHAIIPTGSDPRRAGLDPDEKKLFDLVARRFLAVFLPDALFSVMAARTSIGDDHFIARGRSCLAPGWRAIDPPRSTKKEREVILPALEPGMQARQAAHEIREGRTKPPRRYTEATLLGAMERAGEGLEEQELKRAMKRNGLGTPATRAAIIETLLRRNYVRREAGSLVPSEEGRALIECLPVDELRSARLTGAWEAQLVAIAEGRHDREEFMKAIRTLTRRVVEAIASAEISDAGLATLSRPEAAEGEPFGKCPCCEGEVLAGARGWRCSACNLSIPRSIARREISDRMARALLSARRCPPVKGFRSRAGKEFQAGLEIDEKGEIRFFFPGSEALGDCPACGEPVRQRGRVYSCDTGRDCPFVVFAETSGRRIPESSVRELLEKGHSTLLEGFERRDGTRFTGRLEWNGRRVVVAARDARSAAGSVGACPRCGEAVSWLSGAWRCPGDDFELPARIAGRRLGADEVRALLTAGRTPRLYGFRKRDGKPFRAALVLDLEAKRLLTFDFKPVEDEPAPSLPEGAPPPAFGKWRVCPACFERADPDPGYVIAGKEAWGCSKWSRGCTLRIPFIIEGQRLNEDDARRLLGRERATRYLRGLHSDRGNLPVSRVVLRPLEDPCWKLEAKGGREP